MHHVADPDEAKDEAIEAVHLDFDVRLAAVPIRIPMPMAYACLFVACMQPTQANHPKPANKTMINLCLTALPTRSAVA